MTHHQGGSKTSTTTKTKMTRTSMCKRTTFRRPAEKVRVPSQRRKNGTDNNHNVLQGFPTQMKDDLRDESGYNVRTKQQKRTFVTNLQRPSSQNFDHKAEVWSQNSQAGQYANAPESVSDEGASVCETVMAKDSEWSLTLLQMVNPKHPRHRCLTEMGQYGYPVNFSWP